jgi:hypothetical protein
VNLRLVPKPFEVIVLRRKSLRERMGEDGGATLKSGRDWREFSEMVFGDARLCPVVMPVSSNVVPIHGGKRRSSSREIQAVRISEERRGRRP